MNRQSRQDRRGVVVSRAVRGVNVAAVEMLSLEARQLLCVDHAQGRLPDDIGTFGVVVDDQMPVHATATGGTTSGVAAGAALSAVPVLNSNPNATAQLYLDFNGDTTGTWGQFSPGTTPAYDQDGDTTSFSDGELASIREIFDRVAEKFSPFNINVTTVDPGTYGERQAARAVVGGDGAWLGAQAGGVAYVGGFYNSASNTVFVFPKNLGNGYAKYVAEGVGHESGHAFGLQHQGTWSGTTLTNEYNPGTSAKAPVMGSSYSAARGLWWYGQSSVSSTSWQDDMAVLSNSTNAFGYRADDHGSTTGTADLLTLSGTSASGAGVIEKTSDADFFKFDTGAGTVSFAAKAASVGAMLDLKLELRDAAGNVVGSANTASLGESLSATLAAGTYYLGVLSAGSYGDVGQYSLTGSVVEAPVTPPPPVEVTVDAPSNLSAQTLSASSVRLNWTDNADNESGFVIQRSADGGANWTNVASLGADGIAYTDNSAAAGTGYVYRVYAYNGEVVSANSNNASATTVTVAPSGVAASAVSTGQINLAWNDVFGEAGYTVQRSTDGSTWGNVATVGANVTSYQNTGLAADTVYYYRVIGTNAGGASTPSASASARTLAPVTSSVPAAPSGLVASATSSSSARLTWTDNASNETGFRIEYTTDNRTWRYLGDAGADVTAINVTGLRAKSTYWFRVRAFNASGSSAWSNSAKTTTLKGATAASGSNSPRIAAGSGVFSTKPLKGTRAASELLLGGAKAGAAVYAE